MLDNQKNSPFIKQVSKLFEDLSAKQSVKQVKEHQEPNPRITCTRLRRLREMRRELVLDADSQSNNELIPAVMAGNKPYLRSKGESFADWVLRNQQVHRQTAEKQNKYREEIGKTPQKQCSQNAQGFGGFSPAVLEKVASDSHTPASTLKWLAAHHLAEVRQAVAVNENIGAEILCLLVRDSEDRVREAALDNKCIQREEILRLCNDFNHSIAEKAKKLIYQMAKQEISGRHDTLAAEC